MGGARGETKRTVWLGLGESDGRSQAVTTQDSGALTTPDVAVVAENPSWILQSRQDWVWWKAEDFS